MGIDEPGPTAPLQPTGEDDHERRGNPERGNDREHFRYELWSRACRDPARRPAARQRPESMHNDGAKDAVELPGEKVDAAAAGPASRIRQPR